MEKQLLNNLIELTTKYRSSKNYITSNVNDDNEMMREYNKFFQTQKTTTIEMNKIQKIYDNGISAVNNFNLKINPKEFVCLLGPSGCGKSTTLRMIAGLEIISAGTLKIDGAIVNALQPSQRGLSMVFQNYSLYPYMTVYNNIAFGLKLKSKKNSLIKQINEEIKKNISKSYEKSEMLKEKIRLAKYPNYQKIAMLKENRTIQKLRKDYKSADKTNIQIKELKKDNKISKENSKEKISNYRKELSKIRTNPLLFLPLLWMFSPNSKQIYKLKKARKIMIDLWKRSIGARVRRFANLVDIGDYLQRKPSALSGGQRQRVALARTISKDTSIFLFDEPLSNLDAKLRASMRKEIKDIHNKLEATTIYVTHDQIEAMTMADKVVVMNKGYIVQIDSPQNLYDYPANLFVAKFIGSPEMNIVKGIILSNKEIKIGKKNLKIANDFNKEILNYKEVYVGIRPQHISVIKEITGVMDHNVCEGVIKFKQLIGNDYILSVYSDELEIEIDLIVSTYGAGNIGDKIKFYIRLNHIHLFDKKTELTILSPINDSTVGAQEAWIDGRVERLKNKLIIQKEKSKKSIGEIIYKASKSNIIALVNDSFKRNMLIERKDLLENHKNLLQEQLEFVEHNSKKKKNIEIKIENINIRLKSIDKKIYSKDKLHP